VIVVDASVLAPALAYDLPDGDAARLRLDREEQLFAPEIVDLELAAVWRGAIRAGRLDERRSGRALDDLARLRLVRVGHQMLMPRIWELRHNLTPYDAAYVALAEALDVVLLTADGRSTRAPSLQCRVELLR
jgi:predicted nucleic acid-binding protein